MLIEEVRVTKWHIEIRLRIALDHLCRTHESQTALPTRSRS
jgi:hypothetical protein